MLSSNEAMNVEEKDNPYDSMVRSLTNRGKNKRKVKLLENHLMQFAFGESDSEEDEDFTVEDEEIHSDDSNLVDTVSTSDDEDDDLDENVEDDKEIENEDQTKSMSLGEIISAIQKQSEKCQSSVSVMNETNVSHTDLLHHKQFLICGICLESENDENDEILECDYCGITVHEGCYGDLDVSDDDDKSESDAPTEPWFCEVCKAGMKEVPICELCPSLGGIYKLTDTGKWVHLVCALYTPYIGFRDVTKLQTVVLEDIKSSMWGSSECMCCFDDQFSRTGVCIQCDAGLCKATFHVTCAQRNGFLSDIPDREDSQFDGPDILYAHCKLHSVKLEMNKKKNSWLAFESCISKFKKPEDTIENERIQITLDQAKKHFQEYRRNIVQSKQLHESPRLLSSCPEACMMLARKAEILGLLKHPGFDLKTAVVSGRILNHEAHLSAEFVNYFFKREMQVKELENSIKTTKPVILKLEKEQKSLTSLTDEYQKKFDKVLREKEKLLSVCKELHQMICKLSGKNLKLPEILKQKEEESKAKIMETTKLLSSVVNRCATCNSTQNQHFLVKCETCKNFYHLACVDPPLSRMPKQSDKYVWQCTECDSSEESSDSEVEEDLDEAEGSKRRKRVVKEPIKYTPENNLSFKDPFAETTKRKSSGENKSLEPILKKFKTKRQPKVKKRVKEKSTDTKKPRTKNEQIKTPLRTKGLVKEALNDCHICKKPGDKTNLVKCDECKSCYHFKTCLDPPYLRTPKGKFYSWICEDCDDTGDDENNEEG